MSWVPILRRVVLASIAVGATLGIAVLALGDIGEPGWKVVTTSFLITACALVAMPSVTAWERHRLGWLPVAGAAAAVLGFAWLIVGVWGEFDADALWKVPVTLIIVAVAVAGISLVDFVRLSPGQRWLIGAARAAIGVVALMLVIGTWVEVEVEAYWRVFGVAAVLMTAFLAALPVLHRSQPTSTATTEFCPVCGVVNQASEGVATVCPACDTRYTVDL